MPEPEPRKTGERRGPIPPSAYRHLDFGFPAPELRHSRLLLRAATQFMAICSWRAGSEAELRKDGGAGAEAKLSRKPRRSQRGPDPRGRSGGRRQNRRGGPHRGRPSDEALLSSVGTLGSMLSLQGVQLWANKVMPSP